MFDKRPEVIVRAEQVADVIGAVNFARDAGLDLSVKGGGHSAPGFGTNDGGVVIDLSLMRHVHVDPAPGRREPAVAPPGVISTTPPTPTDWPRPGASSPPPVSPGSPSGGGIGYLSPGYGLTIDNLLSAEVVTADGQVVDASADENQDLFWALRGGGGNFGVVTSFEFQLHPVNDVYVGLFFYELDQAGDLLRFYRDFIKDAPEAYGAFPGLPDRPAAAVHPRRPPRRHLLRRDGPLGRAARPGRGRHEAVPRPGAGRGRDGRAHALPGAERGLRSPLPQGDPQLLEGQLRDRA